MSVLSTEEVAMAERDGEQCLGCGHRNVSHGYASQVAGSGIGMGACGVVACVCAAFQRPRRLRADEFLPGDVIVGAGRTVHSVSHLVAVPRMRTVSVVWEEGLEDNWAPSMFPPAETQPVERDGRPAVGACGVMFGANPDERCTKPESHEPETHANDRFIWGPGSTNLGVCAEHAPERITGGLLDMLEDVSA